MMFESLMQTSPAPENGCWRTAAPPDSSSMVPILIGDDGEKFVRIHPKRLEIRQMRSLDKVNGLIPRKGRCMKKKRPADENNDVECCTSQPEEDVVLQGTSSFVKEAKQDYNVACWSHGSISVIGRRREMEDAVAVELGFLTRGFKKYYDFFGVYDGHGGSSVAKACRHRLHKLVVQMVGEEEDDIINWKKVMSESFKKMDEEVNRNGAAVATVGSTAVVAVVGKDEVVVANCGDSRAVLSRGGTAIPLSSDHKPERPDELERIELSGGKVIDWNGHRILGVLATSRSIGDDYLKPYVIPEPELIVSRRCEEDEFLILATDGLWDVISNDVACHIVRKCLGGHVRRASREMANGKSLPHNTAAKGQAYYNKLKNASLAAEAASILAELAIVRGSCDNISVIVVELRTLRS